MNRLLQYLQSNDREKQEKAIERGIDQLLDEKLKKEINEGLQQLPAPRKPILLGRTWLGMAASLLLIVGFFTIGKPKTPEALATTYFSKEQFFHPGATKGVANETVRVDIYEAFNQNQYAEVVDQFNRLSNLTTEDKYYYGISLLQVGSIQEAQLQFEQIINANGPFLVEAKWFGGLSHIMLDQYNEAIPLLEDISEGSWKVEEATKLLKKIK